ncbi:LAFA_0G01486g1_1 [Lachancea sp. 'fantastica']|nr:LAFA_0G01486g1_1 [Lachancea sp. 'fantastica']
MKSKIHLRNQKGKVLLHVITIMLYLFFHKYMLLLQKVSRMSLLEIKTSGSVSSDKNHTSIRTIWSYSHKMSLDTYHDAPKSYIPYNCLCLLLTYFIAKFIRLVTESYLSSQSEYLSDSLLLFLQHLNTSDRYRQLKNVYLYTTTSLFVVPGCIRA